MLLSPAPDNSNRMSSVIVTTEEQLRGVVASVLREVVSEALPPLVRRATSKDWLTREEVKELTGWSDRTLQHLRDTRQLHFAQHGRKIVYPADGVEEFLRSNRVAARRASNHEGSRSTQLGAGE